MSSTLRKDQHGPYPGDAGRGGYKNGGTHIPLGSEGSSHGSEASSLDNTSPPEKIDVTIVFPNKTSKIITVDYGKQMMDFLVQVTASNQLSPATHTFHVISEETGRAVDYYASQPVGTLGVATLYVIEKKTEQQRKRESKQAAQPFEITHRLTVNLPRNQKMITRVSPKSSLADLFKMICGEKNLDPYKYELRHPTKPDVALNMARPLAEYGLTEITVVNVGADASPRSGLSQLSLDTTDLNTTYDSRNTSTMERKKKKGIFSIFKKKEGKFKPGETNYTASTSTLPTSSGRGWNNSSQTTKYPSTQSRSTASLQHPTSTSSSIHTSGSETLHSRNSAPLRENNNSKEASRDRTPRDQSHDNLKAGQGPPPKPPRKKRQAPPPPPPAAAPAQLSPTSSSQTDSGVMSSNSQHVSSDTAHSRTSSRSSGFDSAGSPLDLSMAGHERVNHAGGSTAQPKALDYGSLPAHISVVNTKTAVQATATRAAKSKKRRAPVPPGGAERVHRDSESTGISVQTDSATSTPLSTPRMHSDTGVTTQGNTTHQSLQESSAAHNLRDRSEMPIFTPPPPPDTPPPSEVDAMSPEYLSTSIQRSGQGQKVKGQVAVADSSTQVHVTPRDSLSSVGHDISRLDSMCSDYSGGELSPTTPKEFPKSGEFNLPEIGEEHRSDATNENSRLGGAIDQSQGTMQISPRSEDSAGTQSKDSLQSETDGNASFDSYHFAHAYNDPALADGDTSVVLLKSKSLDEATDPSGLTESQDSGIGTLSKRNKHGAGDKMSVDSPDIRDGPDMTSDSGVSGDSAEHEATLQKKKSLSISEEINFDQSEVQYVDPDLIKAPPFPDSPETESAPADNNAGLIETPHSVSNATELDKNQSQNETIILEKPKLSHDIEAALANADNAPTKKLIKVKPNTYDPSESNEKQYSKFMSYVESAQIKSGSFPPSSPKPAEDSKNPTSFFVDIDESSQVTDAPLSKKSIQNLNAYREVMRTESFNRERSNPDKFVDQNSNNSNDKRHPFTLTTMEYKADRDGFKGDIDSEGFRVPTELPPKTKSQQERSAMRQATSLRDIYSQPFGSLRETYGKSHQRVSSPSSSTSSDRPPLSPTATYSVDMSVKSECGTTSPSFRLDTEARRSPAVSVSTKDGDNNKRKGVFLGPRPWGARHSEPSVRDVRAALAIHQAKEDARQLSSPTKSDASSGMDSIFNGSVREQVSKIGFTPDTEQESDSFLEEKSISMLALPADKKSILKGRPSYGRKSGDLSLSVRSESMENISGLPPRSNLKLAKSTDNVFEASREKASHRSLQNQYVDLQDQFSRWKQQLMDNQSVLTKQPITRDQSYKSTVSSTSKMTNSNSDNKREANSSLNLRNVNEVTSPTGKFYQRNSGSEFNRRTTIDVGDARKCLLEEIERRGRMFEKYAVEKSSSGTQPSEPAKGTSDRPPITQTQSLDYTSQRRNEPVRRHEKQRYTSLTDGANLSTQNRALAAQVSADDIASARAKLRQNGTDSSKSSTRLNSEMTRTVLSPTTREGNALSPQREADKNEISVEMQYFINRNKGRTFGSRSFESSENDKELIQKTGTVKPDPVYSGRTYGVSVNRGHESKSILSSKSTENVNTGDRVKSTSRIFGSTTRGHAPDSSVKRDFVSDRSNKFAGDGRFTSASTSNLDPNGSTNYATQTQDVSSGLSSRSAINSRQSESRAYSPPRHSTPLKSSGVPPPPSLKSTSGGNAKWNSGRDSSVKSSAGAKKANSRSRFEPKLDPREEMMIAIRNAGRNQLKQVQANDFNNYSRDLQS